MNFRACIWLIAGCAAFFAAGYWSWGVIWGVGGTVTWMFLFVSAMLCLMFSASRSIGDALTAPPMTATERVEVVVQLSAIFLFLVCIPLGMALIGLGIDSVVRDVPPGVPGNSRPMTVFEIPEENSLWPRLGERRALRGDSTVTVQFAGIDLPDGGFDYFKGNQRDVPADCGAHAAQERVLSLMPIGATVYVQEDSHSNGQIIWAGESINGEINFFLVNERLLREGFGIGRFPVYDDPSAAYRKAVTETLSGYYEYEWISPDDYRATREANSWTIPKYEPSEYRDIFLSAAIAAQREGVGLWDECVFDP